METRVSNDVVRANLRSSMHAARPTSRHKPSRAHTRVGVTHSLSLRVTPKLDLEPDKNVDEMNGEPPAPRIKALAVALDQSKNIKVHDVVVPGNKGG
jgi:hypothetical protein